jgi:CheY-like chemotaxis protein/HPt (histidine-containing phosphotransfer) domain-containing protein
MKNKGINAYTCSNALDALQLIQEEQFDIIFSDIQMSEMNGFELVARIRSATFSKASSVPIIGLSAHSSVSETKYKEAGFSGFLSKPFTVQQLFDVIQTHTSINQYPPIVHYAGNEGFIVLTQFAGNDEDAANRIIHSFIDENNKNLAVLKQAFEQEDWTTIASISHKMISLMKMISAQELVSLLQEYEKGSHSQDNKALLLTLIQDKITEAEQFMDRSTGSSPIAHHS